jgi:hypothetical protein
VLRRQPLDQRRGAEPFTASASAVGGKRHRLSGWRSHAVGDGGGGSGWGRFGDGRHRGLFGGHGRGFRLLAVGATGRLGHVWLITDGGDGGADRDGVAFADQGLG